MGTLAVIPAPFNCRDCDHLPLRIGDTKYACVHCGLVQWDAVALVKATFGPGVEKVIVPGIGVTNEVEDWEIERWLDA